MTFKELIRTHTWPSISILFFEIYPDAEKSLRDYQAVFGKLSLMDEEEMDMSIVITVEKDGFDGEEYIDVSGLYNDPKNMEDHYPQGIEFSPWRQWLGMDISKENLNDFSEQEIIVHCLYEMTFMGFTEAVIQKVIDGSTKNREEHKSMTEEERDASTISVEELLKEWNGGNDKN